MRLREEWTADPRLLLDLVGRRVFDVDKEMEGQTRSYLKDRRTLPFTILTTDQLGLLIHMPSSDVRGLRVKKVRFAAPAFLYDREARNQDC